MVLVCGRWFYHPHGCFLMALFCVPWLWLCCSETCSLDHRHFVLFFFLPLFPNNPDGYLQEKKKMTLEKKREFGYALNLTRRKYAIELWHMKKSNHQLWLHPSQTIARCVIRARGNPLSSHLPPWHQSSSTLGSKPDLFWAACKWCIIVSWLQWGKRHNGTTSTFIIYVPFGGIV